MYIEGSPRMIKHLRLKAYGKINLALDVLGRREEHAAFECYLEFGSSVTESLQK